MRGDNRAGLLEAAKFQRDGGADDRGLPFQRNGEVARPVEPMLARPIEELAARDAGSRAGRGRGGARLEVFDLLPQPRLV